MRIHAEGWIPLLIIGLFLVILNGLTVIFWEGWFVKVLLFFSLSLLLLCLQFFRNPKRTLPEQEDSIVSPADGKVVVKEKVFEDEYLQEERIQVSVFMSPVDVHLNRVPVSGKLVYYRYHPGQYLAAYNPKSSHLNEQNSIVIQNEQLGTFLFRQIAGVMARRIRFYHREMDDLKKGEELGFIKFGSRLDLLLPVNYHIPVEIGDQVYGCETIMAFPQPIEH